MPFKRAPTVEELLGPEVVQLRFLNRGLRRVIADAVARKRHLLLVHADTVYWRVARGAGRSDPQADVVSYSEGCDLACDPCFDWLERASAALGTEPGIEHFDPREHLFQHILTSDDDLTVCVKSNCLLLRAVPVDRDSP